MRNIDYSVYMITDSEKAGDRKIVDVVMDAVRGGATMVQLREKDFDSGDFYRRALATMRLLRKPGIPLIINDRLDSALAAGAHGVHIGQNDIPLPLVRKLMGPNKIVGVSVHDERDALAAESGGADYIAVGPVFETDTKPDAGEPVGLEGIEDIRKVVPRIPCIGIGGINIENARSVIEAGCRGVAVISAIMDAENPQVAAQDLLHEVNNAERKPY